MHLMIVNAPEYLDQYVDGFRATPEGLNALHQNDEVCDLVRRFAITPAYPEDVLTRHGSEAGIGSNADVRAISGIILKASTNTSGRDARNYNQDIAPENLLDQFDFMQALHYDLQEREVEGVFTPRQLFALRAGKNYLAGQEYMEGWQTFDTWAANRQYGRPGGRHKGEISIPVKKRLQEALGSSGLKKGVADLNLWNSKELHGSNILVQPDSDPRIDPLCIIDQPSRGWWAKRAVRTAREYLGQRS